MLIHILVLGLAFAPRFLAITNGDATVSPGKRPLADSAVLTPEELLHGVVPCTCIDIRLCPSILNSLKHPISASSIELKHLQRFTCGFKGFTPFVCCNEMANTPMVDASSLQDPQLTRPLGEVMIPTRAASDIVDQTNLGSIGNIELSPTPGFISTTFNPTEEHSATHEIASVPNPYSNTHHGDSKSNSHIPTTESMFYHSSTSASDNTGFYPTESVTTQVFSDPISSDSTSNKISSTSYTPHSNHTDDISPDMYSIPKKHPDNSVQIPTTNIPHSTSHEKDLHNFTTNNTNTFSITPEINTEVPLTAGPPMNANDASNEERFKENPYASYETTTKIPPYLHTDDIPNTFTSSPPSVYVTSPSSYDHVYDPTKDIADIFGNSSQHVPEAETSTPKIHVDSYDPTYDIRDIFGASPNEGSQQPHKPNTQTVPNFPSVTQESFGVVQPSISTSQVMVTPTPGYHKVTKIPDITVTYNLQVKDTNIEKKYVDFFNTFYKNHYNKPTIAEGTPIQTPNSIGGQMDNNFFQISPLKSVQLNSFGSSDKEIRNGKQFPNDNEYYNYETIEKPRSTSTNRYVRQYNPDFYFDNRFAPHYFTRHLSSSPNYYPHPSNRPQSTTNRRTTIYANIHKAQTNPPDSWLYNDYNSNSDSESVSSSMVETDPLPAYQQYNSYNNHNMRNRGTELNRDVARPRPRNRKPATNDGSITFPNEQEDERKPFAQYTPNLDSSYYPGPFYNDNSHRRPYPNSHRQSSRKPTPYNPHSAWGYNHPNHYPNYHEDKPEPDLIVPVNNQPFTDPPKQTNKTPMLANTVSTAAPPAPAPATVPATPVAAVATAPPATSTQAVPVVAPASVSVSPAPPVPVTPLPAGPGLDAKRQLLPRDECGVSVEERIVGGKTATLGAYPWIARIGYLRPGSDRVLYRCAGTLINNLYIITAAHCVTNLPGGLVLSTIRLGELDDTTDPDCVNDECADPVQNYSPTQITVHQTYDKPQFKNDVGLVRLDRPVNITTYVSPICLPFDSLRSKNYTGLKAIVAGWGASNVGTSSATPVLQWVSLTVAPMAQCVTTFATRTGVQVGPGQLCAGGEQGRDSCEGDSGGPLMRPEQPDADSLPRYFLIGIVSFGAKRCGSDNMPGVYTDVASYLDWILASIQP